MARNRRKLIGMLIFGLITLTTTCGAAEVVVEAEAGKLVPPMAIGSDPTASGGKFVHPPHPGTHTRTSMTPEERKGYVELTFTVDEPGAYVIEALTYWPHTAESGIGYGGGQNSFTYVVNDFRTPLTLGNDRDFNVWTWRQTEPIFLGNGKNVVRFYGREYNARLDKIRAVPAETFAFEVPEPAQGMPPWVHYEMAFRSALRKLVHETIQRERNFNARDDQGLFMSYWFPYYIITGDEEAKRYMYEWRDTFLRAFDNNTDGYYHGFSEVGELHHQTENHQRFLGHFWHFDPNDPDNIRVLEDAAEHVGNWVEGIPPWYDWKNHRFTSWWVGTKVVGMQQDWHKKAYGERSSSQPSLKDALRPVNIVLNAYAATGKDRYLKLAQDYVDNLCPTLAEKGWRAGPNTQFLESTLLDLYEATGDEKYLEWTEQELRRSLPWAYQERRVSEELPRLWRYRRLSDDTQFDKDVLDYAAKVYDVHFAPIVFMLLGGCEELELPYPVVFALAGQIADRDDYFARAFSIATEHVEGARVALATGRQPFTDLGDHNRATGLLWRTLNGVYPLLGMRPCFWGQSVGGFDLEFRLGDKVGIPDGIAVLCRKSTETERVVSLYNTGDKTVTFELIPGCTHGRSVPAGYMAGRGMRLVEGPEGNWQLEVTVPPRHMLTVHIPLE